MAKVGRPRKYTPEQLAKLGDGLVQYMKDGVEEVKQDKKNVRFIIMYLADNGVPINDIDQLCEQSEYLTQQYAIAKGYQKDMINVGAMKGLFNAQYTQFVAKNITDMRDRVDVEGNLGTFNLFALLNKTEKTEVLPEGKPVIDAKVSQNDD
jgi:hypothetical protein